MKFNSIEKIHQGEYLTYYHVWYHSDSGTEKCYEMVSRDSRLQDFLQLHSSSPDAVIMILHDESHEKILLNREYRMAVGEWVYNFPAGLIDNQETPSVAARRELREETGLQLTSVEDIWKESYSAVGITNEKGIVVLGTAEGDFHPSTSELEEIHADWYTKEQVRELLSRHIFAARTQAYCYLWSR